MTGLKFFWEKNKTTRLVAQNVHWTRKFFTRPKSLEENPTKVNMIVQPVTTLFPGSLQSLFLTHTQPSVMLSL